jgi:hypothetical protein
MAGYLQDGKLCPAFRADLKTEDVDSLLLPPKSASADYSRTCRVGRADCGSWWGFGRVFQIVPATG